MGIQNQLGSSIQRWKEAVPSCKRLAGRNIRGSGLDARSELLDLRRLTHQVTKKFRKPRCHWDFFVSAESPSLVVRYKAVRTVQRLVEAVLNNGPVGELETGFGCSKSSYRNKESDKMIIHM